MPSVRVDLHVVERLVGEAFDAASASDIVKLGPGEPVPEDPTLPFAQFMGCDMQQSGRRPTDEETDEWDFNGDFLVAAPLETTKADAYQVMTAASVVVAVIGEISKQNANHTIEIRGVRVQRAEIDDLPQYRCLIVVFEGKVQRTTGTTLE